MMETACVKRLQLTVVFTHGVKDEQPPISSDLVSDSVFDFELDWNQQGLSQQRNNICLGPEKKFPSIVCVWVGKELNLESVRAAKGQIHLS